MSSRRSLWPGGRRSRQRGNALVFALLGLLVSALGAAGMIQGNRLQARQAAGHGEATILEKLRNATNDAIFDGLAAIRNGVAFSRNGVTITPVDVGGDLVWKPAVTELAAMGYLPTG